MYHWLFPYLRPMSFVLRDGENEGGNGGGSAGGSFYQGGEGSGGEGGEGGNSGEGASAPDWLMEKYHVKGENDAIDVTASAQKQAEAYRELYGRFSKKTDDLRGEVLQDAVKEYGKTIGVPDDIDGYEYPEGVAPPSNEELDKGFREWAHRHNVAPEGFQELIEIYGQTFPDYEKELEALGPNADERLDAVNKWASKHLGDDHGSDLERLMTTASGVELVEKMMKMAGSSGFAPDGDGDAQPTALTREQIREMQADPKFGTDEGYTAKVRKAWSDFARRNNG
jgi:hypothetical protein